MPASNIPPAVDRLLESLSRRKGLSEPMVVRLSSIGRSLFRAFAEQPPDPGEIGKAIHKIGKCVGPDQPSPDGADAGVVPDLLALSEQLEIVLASPAAAPPRSMPAPAPAPAPASTPPGPPVRSALPAFRPAEGATAAPRVANPAMSPAQVRASIDELLLALERNKGLPAPLSRAVNSAFLYVLRAFGKSPTLRGEVADALDRVKQCLELARTVRGEAGAAALSDLTRLSQVVESQFPSAVAHP